MRPWPALLAERYPLPPGVVPERPWWREAGPRSRKTYTRRDGQERFGGTHDRERFVRRIHYTDGSGYRDVWACRDRLFTDALAELDTEKPLPHPGFRVGQVWAAVSQKGGHIAWQIVRRHEGEDVWVLVYEYPVHPMSLDTARLTATLQDAYLVGDVCCPWLAPWAPSVQGASPT